MVNFIKAGVIASFCFLLFGCANAAFHVKQVKASTEPHTISDVPFYPQQEFFCGPTTLAEVANYYGHSLNPEDIAPQIFIPNREGSLQLEMVAAARQLGFLAYKEHGDLTALVNLVNQNIPVIVLQNNGISWLPQWHYSVVVGFDLPEEEIILHTGLDEQLRVNVGVFMNTWQRSKNWYLALLPPNGKLKYLNQFEYVKSAQDLLATRQFEAGVNALITATYTWPEYWLSYFLLGNHYFNIDSKLALDWYKKGIVSSPAAGNEINYLNNYAYALAENGCSSLALKTIQQALTIKPTNENLLQSEQELLKTNRATACELE